MKTKGMSQQVEALRLMEGKKGYGLFMEQGTGKTWTLLADGERLYMQGLIDAICVIAPKGVHTNWVLREIPTHMEGEILARAWTRQGGVKARKKLEELFNPRARGGVVPLRVFAVNIDAINTKEGYEFTKKFLQCSNAMLIIDESSRIKNPDAKRTKEILKLSKMVRYRRIATGTPITKGPIDVFTQMEFLESGLLGTTSYRAFVSEYSDLMSANDPMMREMIKRNPKAAHAQIVRRDAMGRPIWRNLDKLQKLLTPHTFRITKAECLDLPAKIFQTHYFELTAAQRKVYDVLEEESRILLEDGTKAAVQRLAALTKLQQITSGYVIVPVPGEEPVFRYVSESNPRLEALEDLLEDKEDDQIIIWARYRPELASIASMLKRLEIPFAEYHGGISTEEREQAIDDFQSGKIRVFVANAQSGGIGLTLTNANLVIYYSNSFDLELRLQSEDRAHRIGQKKSVVYIDLAAQETIDQSITRSLQQKADVAAEILGDFKQRETL